MLYKPGQMVQWKKYIGKVHFVFEYNKSYMITLYDYRGFPKIDRQLNEYELSEYEQLSIV